MKFRITSIIAFFAAFVLSSCTLVMNDIDFPADQLGFTEPVTQSGPNGTVTYQFNENVKSVAKNILPYVSHMEGDSVVYYFDNTPQEYIPKVGELVSAPVSRILPRGLNHHVISVEKVPGFVKIGIYQAGISEVYSMYEGSFTFEAECPSMVALDSVEAAAYGLLDDDIALVDFSQVDAADPEAAEEYKQNSKRRTRGKIYDVDESKWKPQDNIDLINTEKKITICSIDTRRSLNSGTQLLPELFSDMRSFADKVNKELGGGKPLIDSPIYFAMEMGFAASAQGKYNIGSKSGQGETVLDGQMTIYPSLFMEFTIGYDNGKPLSKKAKQAITDFIKKHIKSPSTNFKLPAKAVIPIGTTPLAVYIKPNLKLDIILNASGTISQAIHFDPIPLTFTAKEFYTKIPPGSMLSYSMDEEVTYQWKVNKLDKDPNKDKRVQTDPRLKSLCGEVGLSLGSTLETGVELFGIVDAGIELGPVGTVKAEFNYSDTNVEVDKYALTSGNGGYYDAYNFDDNGIECTVKFLVNGALSIADKRLATMKIYSGTLFRGFSAFLPQVTNAVFKKRTFNDAGFLETLRMDVTYASMKDMFMIKGAQPALIITGAEMSRPTALYVIDKPLTNGTFSFECEIDPEMHKQDKLIALPAIMKEDGEALIVYASKDITNERVFDSSRSVMSSGIYMEPLRLVTSVKINDMEATWADWALKGYKDVDDSYYFYQVLCKVSVVPGEDLQEWGIELRDLSFTQPDGSNEFLVSKPYTYAIENAQQRPISRGVRKLLFSFVGKLDAESYVNDEAWGPQGKWDVYQMELQPYYIKKGKTDHSYPPGNNQNGLIDIRYTPPQPSDLPIMPDPEVTEIKSYNLNKGFN